MEHIGETLGSLHRETSTPSQKTTEPETEPTLEERREELRRSLGVSSLDNTFENFKPVAGTEKALGAFKSMACDEAEFKMLLIYGGVGNGKTHLCEATAIALYLNRKFCRVMTMDRMMAVLKECMAPDRQTSLEELLSNYCYTERLIIDDVEGSAWEFEQLERIIRVRYRENLFTILTTNRNLNELPERLVSRFRDAVQGRVILNEAGDYRPERGKR